MDNEKILVDKQAFDELVERVENIENLLDKLDTYICDIFNMVGSLAEKFGVA